jgi:putative ABC transport system permease protein
MNLFIIAWRNLWRNKRRTAITSASILFAVFFALIMRSYQLGFYDHMIKNAIESYSGFLQIQQIDYQDDPSLDNTFSLDETVIESIRNTPGIKAVVPRVETFALASSGMQTKGAMILGIDPKEEKSLSNPENNLIRYRITKEVIETLQAGSEIPDGIKAKLNGIMHNSYTNTGTIAMDLELDVSADKNILDTIARVSRFPGKYLMENDEGALVSERLAKYLRLNIGDTLILFGQGYHGSTAADLFPIRGIVKLANPELDNKLVYVSIAKAQGFTGLGNNISSISINLDDNSDKGMLAMENKLTSIINDQTLIVRNWKEFNKVLWQQIEGDNQSGKAFLGLLYFIIFFGIFGTVLMMIHERYREFGVLISIGMQKNKLALSMIYEMIFMGILGVLSGIIASLPVIFYFYYYPIRLTGDMAQTMEDMGFEALLPLASPNMYVLWQSLIVAFMVALSCAYPLRKVFKLKVIEALRA